MRSEWTVATVVLLCYGVWLAAMLPSSHGARDFIIMGRTFVRHSGVSPAIAVDDAYYRRLGAHDNGYDGQFCYYIALDPVNARYYVDTPGYRYTRILYPLVARLLALGQAALIPYTLLLVNLLAVAGGTLAVAAWLARRAVSPWFGLVYGFYPGLFVGLRRDLTEPVSYALVALAILLFDDGGRRRVAWAGLAFALAILTREVAAFFALLYGLSLLRLPQRLDPRAFARREVWGQAALLLALAGLPLLLYKGFLLAWLGSTGVPSELSPFQLPFHGIAVYWPWAPGSQQLEEARTVILPALVCAGIGVWALWRRAWRVEVWALLVNVLVFVVLLPPYSYHQIFASSRITTGVVLAALLCLPIFDKLMGKNRWWFWVSAALWLSFLPYAVASGQ